MFFIFFGLDSILTRNVPPDPKNHSKSELLASILTQSMASGPQNPSQSDLQVSKVPLKLNTLSTRKVSCGICMHLSKQMLETVRILPYICPNPRTSTSESKRLKTPWGGGVAKRSQYIYIFIHPWEYLQEAELLRNWSVGVRWLQANPSR